jgi:hypothetical protein
VGFGCLFETEISDKIIIFILIMLDGVVIAVIFNAALLSKTLCKSGLLASE